MKTKLFRLILPVLVFCSLLTSSNFSFSQSSALPSILPLEQRHIWITINPIRPIVDEASLNLEIGLKKNKALELRGGILYPNRPFGAIAAGIFNSPRFFYHGGLAGVGIKKYDVAEKRNYWGAFLTYRHKYFDDRTIYVGGRSDYDYYLSQRREQFNLQVLRGGIRLSGNLVNEFYLGLGYTVIDVRTRFHGCSICNEEDGGEIEERHKPRFSNGIFHYPTFHVGYRFGVKLK
jgi:hypothetical protein